MGLVNVMFTSPFLFKEVIMNYNEFKKNFAKEYFKRVGTELKNIMVEKPEGTLEGFTLGNPGDKVQTVLYFKDMYDRYNTTNSMDNLFNEIEDIMNKSLDISGNINFSINDIIICMLNKNPNPKFLNDCPTGEFLGMKYYYRILLGDDEEGFRSACLTNRMTDALHYEVNSLFDAAIVNTKRLMRPMWMPLNKLCKDWFGTDLPGGDLNIPMYVITNEKLLFGASSIFYKDILDELYNKIGEYYLIPSSIHEFLAVKADIPSDIDSLFEMHNSVQSEQVQSNEQLSDDIFKYNGDKLAIV